MRYRQHWLLAESDIIWLEESREIVEISRENERSSLRASMIDAVQVMLVAGSPAAKSHARRTSRQLQHLAGLRSGPTCLVWTR